MKRLLVCLAMSSTVILAGCTADAVRNNVKSYCDYEPTIELVVGVAKDITGVPPGVGIGIDAATKVSKAICTAAAKKKEGGARAYVLVESVNEQTGVVSQRTFSGKLVGRYKP
jgi:hypothetical protein